MKDDCGIDQSAVTDKTPLFIDVRGWQKDVISPEVLAKKIGAKLVLSEKQLPSDKGIVLSFTQKGLALNRLASKESPVLVDFVSGKLGHRRKFGGGKGQTIAKAIGMNKGVTPSVLDATGGLGRDAFVLASLGCHVTMIERSPIIAALLDDGLRRAALEIGSADIVSRITLINADAIATMKGMVDKQKSYDVIYLDPMFPDRKKSALVKKEMRLFHDIVGDDPDSDRLLVPAMSLAQYRVVIKRPKQALDLDGKESSYRLPGKSCRYDVHTLKRFPSVLLPLDCE